MVERLEDTDLVRVTFERKEVTIKAQVIIVALTLGAIACAGRTEPTSGPVASPSLTGSIPEQTDYPGERAYKELAQVVPSHGGMYFDTLTGDLTVYLKDLSEGPAAKRALPLIFGQGLASARARHPQSGIVFKQGTYTFIELARWRDALNDFFFETSSVHWWGIDHAGNRIVVGVLSGTDSEAIVAKGLELGVPGGALRFERTGRFQAVDTVPARLILERGDTAAIIIPDTVRRGHAFTVTVTAFAGGCTREAGGSRVSIDRLVADVTPLHVSRVVGSFCHSDLILLPHTISLRFDRAGLGRIRFHGAKNQLDSGAQPQWVVIERTVVVR